MMPAFLARPLLLLALATFVWLPAEPVEAAQSAASDAPARSLARMSEAIERADVAAFEREADVNAILDQALNLVMQAMSRPENAVQTPPLLALIFSQASGDGGAAARKLLKGEALAFIRHGVASGAFAGRQPKSAPAGLLAPLFAEASLGRKEIRQVGAPRPDGQDWLLPFVIHDGGNGNDYSLLGRFSPSAGGCRLTAVENLGELLERIRRESLEQ